MLTGCPDPELNDVALSDCAENFGQVQKLIIMHLYKADGTRNKFEPNALVSPTDPALKANWIPLFAASDETKPVETPFISEPASEPGAMRTYGGGNVTPNGVTLNIGREPQPFTCKVTNQKQIGVIDALKTFQKGSGSGRPKLGVVLINQSNQFMFDSNGLADDAETLELYPIPFTSFFVSDMGFGQLEGVDHNMISWMFLPDWSDKVRIWTPTDFAPLDVMKTLA